MGGDSGGEGVPLSLGGVSSVFWGGSLPGRGGFISGGGVPAPCDPIPSVPAPALQCGRVWAMLMRRQSPPPMVAMVTVAGSSAGPGRLENMQIGGGAHQQKPRLIMPSFAYRAPGRQPGLGSSPLPKAAASSGGPGRSPVSLPRWGGQNTWGPCWGGGVPNTWVPPVGGCTRWGIPNRCVPPWGAADLGGSWSLPSRGRRQGEVPAHLCPFPRWGGCTWVPHTCVPSHGGGVSADLSPPHLCPFPGQGVSAAPPTCLPSLGAAAHLAPLPGGPCPPSLGWAITAPRSLGTAGR